MRERFAEFVRGGNPPDSSRADEYLRTLVTVTRAMSEAVRRYVPDGCDGPTILVWSSEAARRLPDADDHARVACH